MRLSCPPWSPDMVRECLEPFCVSVTAPRQQAGACDDIEARVAREHPLRRIRELVNGALSKLDEKFDALRYLRVTQEGQQWIANLYANVFAMEHRGHLLK